MALRTSVSSGGPSRGDKSWSSTGVAKKQLATRSISIISDIRRRRFDVITTDPNRMEEISLFLALIVLMSATMFKATHDARKAGWPMPDAAHKLIDGGSIIVLVGASLFMMRLAATPVIVTCRQRRVRYSQEEVEQSPRTGGSDTSLLRVRSSLLEYKATPSDEGKGARKEKAAKAAEQAAAPDNASGANM